MKTTLGVHSVSLWLLVGLAFTGCWTTSASHPTDADPVRSRSVPGHRRAELAQELRDHASYLRQVADRREQQADELAKKMGPEDEGIIYRMRSLADQIRRQADDADQKARELGTASTDRREDHAMMARFYQQESERLANEAEQYAEVAAAIDPPQDPKGIRRGELLTAAQQHRQQAAEMKKRAALHATKAAP